MQAQGAVVRSCSTWPAGMKLASIGITLNGSNDRTVDYNAVCHMTVGGWKWNKACRNCIFDPF